MEYASGSVVQSEDGARSYRQQSYHSIKLEVLGASRMGSSFIFSVRSPQSIAREVIPVP